MLLIVFLAVIAAVLFLLLRFRKAPTIYWLTGGLLMATAIWNPIAAGSCEGGCNIRVDLVVIIPILLIALVLSAKALFKK